MAINVTLSWTAPTTYEDGTPVGTAVLNYDVYRATTADLSNAVKLNSAPLSVLTYLDQTTASKNTYYYYVLAYAVASIPSAASNTVSVKTWPPNKPPQITVIVT